MCARLARAGAEKGIKMINNERDEYIFWILSKLNCARVVDICWLAGFTDITYTRKKLLRLVRAGFIGYYVIDGYKCYYLLNKGMREIGQYGRVYEKSYTTYHVLEVARVCTWLYVSKGVSFEDCYTDKRLVTLFQNKNIHRPDIMCGKKVYEVERTVKTLDRLKKNIEANRAYEKQVWLMPKRKIQLKKNIQLIAERYGINNVEVLSLEQIEAEIEKADVHKNVFRPKKTLEEIEVTVHTKNDKLSKYFGRD